MFLPSAGTLGDFDAFGVLAAFGGLPAFGFVVGSVGTLLIKSSCGKASSGSDLNDESAVI